MAKTKTFDSLDEAFEYVRGAKGAKVLATETRCVTQDGRVVLADDPEGASVLIRINTEVPRTVAEALDIPYTKIDKDDHPE